MSKRLIHIAKINRIRNGVKIWLLELATVENGNASRMREEGELLNCNFLLISVWRGLCFYHNVHPLSFPFLAVSIDL